MPYSPVDTTPVSAPTPAGSFVLPTLVRYDLNMLDAGLVLTFTYFVNSDSFAAVAPPTIFEAPVGHGAYYFEVDWSNVSGATTIRYLVESGAYKVAGTISARPGGAFGGSLDSALG